MASPPVTKGSSIPANAVALTPSDTVTYSPPLQGVRVTGAGDVTFLSAFQASLGSAGVPVTWTALAGEIIPVQMATVYATGTTATGLIALGPN